MIRFPRSITLTVDRVVNGKIVDSHEVSYRSNIPIDATIEKETGDYGNLNFGDGWVAHKVDRSIYEPWQE